MTPLSKLGTTALLLTGILGPLGAQTPAALGGFLGIPWETPRTQVVKLLQAQKELKFSRTDPNGLIYFGTYHGHPAEVEFVFAGDRFCLGLVALHSDPPAVEDLYRTVASEIAAEVANPPTVATQAPEPLLSRWLFAEGNYILLTVNTQPLQLLEVYADQALASRVGQAQ